MIHLQLSSRRVVLYFSGLMLIVVVAIFATKTIKRILGTEEVFSCIISKCDQTNLQTKNVEKFFEHPNEPRFQFAGPLYVHPNNPRYFTDDGNRAILLTGSHTWLNLQDGVLTDPPPAFEYTGFLDFLEAHNHNFFRLWFWEQTKWAVEWNEPYYFSPHPYQRTGPGNALDGKPKFDLMEFNQSYFDRLRQRIMEAGQRGLYVSIMLFDGWSVDYPKARHSSSNPWKGHPFNIKNNINGIDGDPNSDDSGTETHELAVTSVTAIQELYVKKVIDTINDLDNVLYEISNESSEGSHDWQYHMINLIKNHEATKPKQHPVGMTVEYPGQSNSVLFASPADWISPYGDINNPSLAKGNKVIISDTDHLCGICGDRAWVWKSFMSGENPIFMDQYDDSYKLEGGGYDMNNPNDVSLRLNMGYAQFYANRMNLAAMTPRRDLCSTGYCLANPATTSAEYLVYQPKNSGFSVDLSGTSGQILIEWLNPETGEIFDAGSVSGGGNQNYIAPFSGDAVLYLYQEESKAPTLSIEKSGPIVAKEDTPIVYSLSIANSGNAEATNLIITDEIPDGATYLSGGMLNGNIVTWNVSKLSANSSTAVHFTVKATDTIVNSEYSVTADGGYKATGSKPVTTLIVSHFIYLPMMISMAGD